MWKSIGTNRRSLGRKPRSVAAQPPLRRTLRAERLEPRLLFAANPLHVGIVYIETDFLESESGTTSDEVADRFLLSFQGGAENTELRELRLSLDKDQDGLSIGDLIFDTAAGGKGKAGWHPFQVTQIDAASGHRVSVAAEVVDGGTALTIRLQNFRAGDLLEFSIDVDEVLRMHADPVRFNQALDVIASGQEMQDALFWADFVAPHYEPITADALFVNDYGNPLREFGIDLPPDQGAPPDSFPSRSAAAVATVTQIPQPISLSGHVWVDDDLDKLREPGEAGLAGVSLTLMRLNEQSGDWVDTGFRDVTDAQGAYHFETVLGLKPDTYQIVHTRAPGYFGVGAVVGSVAGQTVGTAVGTDRLTQIQIPHGDQHAVNYDFAVARPARVSGAVYRDDNDNGRRDTGEPGIAGSTIRLVPINALSPIGPLTTQTLADGAFSFIGLPPGQYDIVQVSQPTGLDDGLDRAGTVDGHTVGRADLPGDAIRGVTLLGNSDGVNYWFGELPRGVLSGGVFLPAPGEDCAGPHSSGATPLAGAAIELVNAQGQTVARTTTGLNGGYRFDNVSKGVYSIVETTPAGLFEGDASVGEINGIVVGSATGGSTIGQIVLPAGGIGSHYNFCEAAPARVSGSVYHDANDNGVRESDESPIRNVAIQLRDSAGLVVATATTDATGRYEFTGLRADNYEIRQTQPAGYLDGLDSVGTIDGVRVGTAIDPGDRLTGITLRQGQAGIEYNFGERLPAQLTGRVHVDGNDNGRYEPGERLLAGVTIRLIDQAGREVAVTQTDAEGRYAFTDILPGTYSVVEEQPAGYFPGDARAGSAGGSVPSPNQIVDVVLSSGQFATDYDFWDIPPAGISGSVFADQDRDGRPDPGELGLAGVSLELFDRYGNFVARTSTATDGSYRFENLEPGVYSIRQTQPSGYFQGGQLAGDFGGDATQTDLIGEIRLPGGAAAARYDFAELAPSIIAGYVFQDGPLLQLPAPLDPPDLRAHRDGVRRPDSTPISGVSLSLRDENGLPLSAERFLPGEYPSGGVVVTDEFGYFEFIGLAPGGYSLFQAQPDGYVDGLDTPGSRGGTALNPADLAANPDLQAIWDQLRNNPLTDPNADAIIGIVLEPGSQSLENWFSEIRVEVVVPKEPIDPIDPIEPLPLFPAQQPSFDRLLAPAPENFAKFAKVAAFGAYLEGRNPLTADDEYEVTWHLSIVNGGFPRGDEQRGGLIKYTAARVQDDTFDNAPREVGVWTFVDRDGNRIAINQVSRLGSPDAIPLVGDFDGDGTDEIAIYVNGHWYVDLNGNGVWDQGDLWLNLGTELDRPIIGDWDGDGKADIAIFGRQWGRDPEAIIQDPGLPSPANTLRRELPHTMVSQTERAARLRAARSGNPADLSADAVDHVFRYGDAPDVPVAGDWNDDGLDAVGIFRDGRWTLDTDGDGRLSERDETAEFGRPGDFPIVGDWDGDGTTNLGVIRGDWWIIDSDGDRRITGNDRCLQIPRPNENAQPIVGDWDGDGRDEFGWYHEAM